MKAELVPEDLLQKVHFVKSEIHHDKTRRIARSRNLKKAMKLGNLYKNKVKIYYQIAGGTLKQIETSVWAVGNEFVCLKKGNTIPIWSIDHVEF